MGGNKRSIFQLLLLGVFGALAIIGTAFLAFYRGDTAAQRIRVPITIWGPPLLEEPLKGILESIRKENDSYNQVTYVTKNDATMYRDLLESLASGTGPDLVIYDATQLLTMRRILTPISFETLPVANFRQTFVEGAEIFVLQNGTYALPLVVDPLVLYWNRDLFTNAAVAEVPSDWTTFVRTAPRLSVIQDGNDLVQGAIALGEYDNINHAVPILSSLIMQAGADFVQYYQNGEYRSMLIADPTEASAALRFYTDFSNPVKLVYSWNKTFDRSTEAFAANAIAMYGGMVSDGTLLTQINPNLNFDMALWPQSSTGGRKVTFGEFYGIGIVKDSRHQQYALQVAWLLAQSKTNAAQISELAGLPSVRRDVLNGIDPADPFAFTTAQSALMAKAWLQPDRGDVNDIFKRMVNGIVSGVLTPQDAVFAASKDLDVALEE